MTAIRWERYPLLAQLAAARLWLQSQSDLNLARNTIEAYGRALEDFFSFCARRRIAPEAARREDIAAYVQDLSLRPGLHSRLGPHHQPTRLAKAYADADYFRRNLRTVEVLLDREAVVSGAALEGEPWKYYDLGHGYCTYDFFEQCAHRMICAKCDFYVPKESSPAQLLEARTNLQRMMQEIPLREEERAAVDDGLAAVGRLYEKLADVPTPDGRAPRELRRGGRRALPVVPVV